MEDPEISGHFIQIEGHARVEQDTYRNIGEQLF